MAVSYRTRTVMQYLHTNKEVELNVMLKLRVRIKLVTLWYQKEGKKEKQFKRWEDDMVKTVRKT